MSWIVRAARAVWDFVVGDDPWTAFGVVVALGATALLADSGAAAWRVMPVAALALPAL